MGCDMWSSEDYYIPPQEESLWTALKDKRVLLVFQGSACATVHLQVTGIERAHFGEKSWIVHGTTLEGEEVSFRVNYEKPATGFGDTKAYRVEETPEVTPDEVALATTN